MVRSYEEIQAARETAAGELVTLKMDRGNARTALEGILTPDQLASPEYRAFTKANGDVEQKAGDVVALFEEQEGRPLAILHAPSNWGSRRDPLVSVPASQECSGER